MRVGYCAITGDILHHGHINFLGNCRALCDYLIVGIMTDEIVEKYKGRKPIMNYAERAKVIEAIKYVDEIRPQNSFEFDVLPKKVDIVFDNAIHNRRVTIAEKMLINYTEGISSTMIKRRIYDTHNC